MAPNEIDPIKYATIQHAKYDTIRTNTKNRRC